ncbi:MAG: nicotinate (nicotinamide) nucleotide adenylyltransferase [Myxococcota bacterium]
MSADRAAIYGGSFDPPHMGHVLAVAWALGAGEVDHVWVIPTWKHPFDKEHGADFEARVEMCKLAFAGLRNAEISTVERDLGGVSRTLSTIEALGTAHPEASFRLLIGADILGETNRWHRWPDVAAAAPPLVVGRAGYPLPDGCPIAIPDVNSTDIRQGLAQGSKMDGLVPHEVLAYVRAQGLYRDAP